LNDTEGFFLMGIERGNVACHDEVQLAAADRGLGPSGSVRKS
jgi:hypothetical protein